MKSILKLNVAGAVLATTLALSGVSMSATAASASAALPEFKPESGKFPVAFTSTSGAGTLETVKKETVKCTADKDQGEISGAKAVSNTTVTFTGCTGPLSSHCQTAGAKEGEIITKALKGKPVYINEAEKSVGLALEPQEGTEFVVFECVGIFGIKATLKVKGSVIGQIPAENAAKAKQLNEQRKTLEILFKQKAGIQEPTEYEEGGKKIPDFLETESKGAIAFGYEQSGEETTDTNTTTENVELKA